MLFFFQAITMRVRLFCARIEEISCKASYLHPPVQAFMNYRLLPRNKQSQLTKNESASSLYLNYNYNFQMWCWNHKWYYAEYYAEIVSVNTHKKMIFFFSIDIFFWKVKLVYYIEKPTNPKIIGCQCLLNTCCLCLL